MYELTNDEETRLRETINGMTTDQKLFVFCELAKFVANDYRAEFSEKELDKDTAKLVFIENAADIVSDIESI